MSTEAVTTDTAAIIAAIERVRRSMPRNADVMAICDDWHRLHLARSSMSRQEYMRLYMKERRRRERASK